MTFKKPLRFISLLLAAVPLYSHAHVAVKNITVAPTQVTVQLEADQALAGHITLVGYGASCGSVSQTVAGQDSRGRAAYRSAAVAIPADTVTSYTLRNLLPSNINYLEEYALCLTDGSEVVASPFSLPRMTEYPSPVWADIFRGTPGEDFTLSPVIFAADGTPYVAQSYVSSQSGTIDQKIMKYQNNVWKTVGLESSAAYAAMAFSPDGMLYAAYFKETGNPPPNDLNIEIKKFDGESWALVGVPLTSVNLASLDIAFSGDASTPYLFASGMLENRFDLYRFDGSAWVSIPFSNPQPYRITRNSMALADDGTPYVAFIDSSDILKVMKYDGGNWAGIGEMAARSMIDETALAFSPEGTLYLAHHQQRENKISIREYAAGGWNEINSHEYGASSTIKE